MIEYKVKVYPSGTRHWYLNGNLHREDGPAIENSYGSKEWYLNGNLHREDGPAIEDANGSKEWYLNDKRHREDGPAVEHSDGSKEWYLNGKNYTEEEYKAKLNPTKEYSIEQLEKLLGHPVKIIGENND